jgi:HAMP domain-containing protein
MTNLANQDNQPTNQSKNPLRNHVVITLLISMPIIILTLFVQWELTLTITQMVTIGMAFIVLIVVINLVARRFENFSLRTKLIVAFLAITFITTLPIFIINQSAARTNLVASANQKLSAAASETAVIVDTFLQNELATVREEARLIQLGGFLETPIDEIAVESEEKALEFLTEFRNRSPLNIASYAILDSNGQVLLEVPASNKSRDESDRTYFIEPISSGQPYISPVEFSDNGDPFIYFSSIIRNNNGEIVGVLRVQYKASILQELVTKSTGRAGGQSFAVLFDENYLHLAHGTAPETLYQLVAPIDDDEYMKSLHVTRRLPNRPMGEFTGNLTALADSLDNAAENPFFEASDIATEDAINQVAVISLDSQPWLVAFFQPQEVFLAPVVLQARTTFWVTGFIAIFVILFAVTLSQLLIRPLVQLSNIAIKVSKGDLSTKANIDTNDEIGILASSFNSMTDQLQDLIVNLESRIDARTRALVTSAEISRRLSLILDKEQLINEVVTQVQSAFDFYHTHIYLFDELGTTLELVGGSGEAGKKMMDRGHKLEQSQGLVGRAATANQVVLVPDVSKDSDWLPNPLLPETKAEIAVPIAVGDEVLGVLDVQHHVVNGLAQRDADLLLSITNQMAIALQNAGLLENAHRQSQREIQINNIAQQIQNTTTVDEALQIAVREVGRAVGSPQTAVRLMNQSRTDNGNSKGK